jgi:DNA repair exonuclease SbcCD ATPase subunit
MLPGLPVILAAAMLAGAAHAERGSDAGPSAEVRQRAEELAREASRRYDEVMGVKRVAQVESEDARDIGEARSQARAIPDWLAAWLERSDRAYRGLVRRLFSGGEASPPPGGRAPRSIVRREPAGEHEAGWDWLTHSDDGFQVVMRRLSVRQAWDPARVTAKSKTPEQSRPVEDRQRAAQATEAKAEQEKQAAAQTAAAEASTRAEAEARAKAAERAAEEQRRQIEEQQRAAQAAHAAAEAKAEQEKQAAARAAAAEARRQAEEERRAKAEAEWVARLQRRQAEDRQAAEAAAKAKQEKQAREAVAAAQEKQARQDAEQRQQAEARKRADEDAARLAAARTDQDQQRTAAAAKAEQERRLEEAATAQARARERQRTEQEKQAQEATAAKAERARQEAERLAQTQKPRDEKAPGPGKEQAAPPPASIPAPARPPKANSAGTARDHKARRRHKPAARRKPHRRHRAPHCSSLRAEAITAGWYQARRRDTLWAIAERHYGRAASTAASMLPTGAACEIPTWCGGASGSTFRP